MESTELKKVKENFGLISQEERNAIVVEHLKTVSKWDLKRILCNVLNVESYMDDEGLESALKQVVHER